MVTLDAVTVETSTDGVAWTDRSAHLIAAGGLSLEYGIQSNGPLDNLADVGTAAFDLQNWNVQGQYSPGHASWITAVSTDTRTRIKLRPGISLASSDGDLIASSDGDTIGVGPQIKFDGRIAKMDPDAGVYGPKRSHLSLEDHMGPLADAVVRNITTREDASENDLFQAVFDAVPDASRPPIIQFDNPLDVYAIALDDVGAGQQAMGLLQDVNDGAFGMLVQRGDGTVITRNRNTLFLAESVGSIDTFDENDCVLVQAPTAQDDLNQRVDVQVPQLAKGVSIEVLAAAKGSDTQGIPDTESRDLWLSYTDPNDTAAQPASIGGIDFEDLNDGATDYRFTDGPAGTGADVTADMVVTVDPVGGGAAFAITNNSGGTAYRDVLQIRGKAIRRYAPAIVFAETVSGNHQTLPIQLRYQENQIVAQYIASTILNATLDPGNRPQRMAILPHRSERLMRHALEREPGDVITARETVTGLNTVVRIQAVRLTLASGRVLACEWVVRAALPLNYASG